MHEFFTVENVWSVVDTAAMDCHRGSKIDFNENDIAKVFYYNSGCNCGDLFDEKMCNTWCDTWSIAIFQLKDGRYILANEASDTSGHGCQCGGSVETFDCKQDLINCGFSNCNREEMVKYLKDE